MVKKQSDFSSRSVLRIPQPTKQWSKRFSLWSHHTIGKHTWNFKQQSIEDDVFYEFCFFIILLKHAALS